MIDWQIRLGDILVVVSFAGTVLLGAYRLGSLGKGLEVMQREIIELKEVAKGVNSVLTTLAVQKTELDHLRAQVDELKHGRGFVIPKVSEIS